MIMNDQRQANVDDMIRTELQRLMLLSKELRDKIKDSKTNAKKNLYSKKLKKNNLKLMNIMTALNKLQDKGGETAGEPE